MSTKNTLMRHDGNTIGSWPTGFHLYEDMMDETDGSIYLNLQGVDFEASPNSVTVAIPRDWASMLGLVK